MGCSCTRENALKVVTSNKLQQDKSDVVPINNSISYNNFGTTKNPSSHHNNYGNNISLARIDKINKDFFTIILSFSKDNRKQLLVSLDNKQEYTTLIQLLNKALFESSEYDCNFISTYNEEIDDYEYQIQRINEYETIGNFTFDQICERLRNKKNKDEVFDCRYDSEENSPIKKANKPSKNYSNLIENDDNNKLTTKQTVQGIVWNLYLNNILEDFSNGCRENRVVHKEELIEIKYEKI